MKRKIILSALLLLLSISTVLGQQGALKGVILDKYSKEPIPFASIQILKNDSTIKSSTSDYDGNYLITFNSPGLIDVHVSFVGYTSVLITEVIIRDNQIRFLNIELKPTAEMLDVVEIIDYKVPLINKDQTASGATISTHGFVNKSSSSKRKSTTDNNNSTYFNKNLEPGQLTATEINDFSKWNLWQDIQKKDLKKFQGIWKISPQQRYSVQVLSNNNMPVVDAGVFLENSNDSILWKTRTDNTGKAELWYNIFGDLETKSNVKLVVNYNNETYDYNRPNIFKKGINTLKLPVECNHPNNIDIAFMVDATGSMDDEIDFLKTDLIDIINNTKENYKEASIRLGSVFYRCFGNSYVTKMSQLSSATMKTSDFINRQSAGEGGIEVVEEAFKTAVDSLKWSQSARARLLFFVLDEEPLRMPDVVKKMQVYTRKAAEKGIRVIPIVASAESTYKAESMEYLMRSIALATNGTSIFLTDHSNIGNEHAVPTTDQYDVELLNNLIKRIIYQFCYIPTCNEKISSEGVSDTTYIFNSPMIAHEVIDNTRNIKEITPKTRLVDYSIENDTIDNENLFEKKDDYNDDTVVKDVSLEFYPNPTSGKITVNIVGSIDELYLFDISGKIISKYNMSNKSTLKLILDDYGTGIYFLKYHDKVRWHSGKIILSR